MKVAVVGAGVAGISASYFLKEYSEHDVHLFEAADYVGGHAHAIPVPTLAARAKRTVGEPVEPNDVAWTETAFIVFNTVTYPHFCKFLKLLGVSHLESSMSWSVCRDRGAYEWASHGLGGVFLQWQNWFRPTQWRMLWDMLRFNATATRILLSGEEIMDGIGLYLERNGYSPAFRDDYLIPLTAAIWSTPPDETALDFPTSSLIRFMYNHHLMQIEGRPQWLSVAGSSKAYIDKVLGRLPAAQKHFSTPVNSVSSGLRADGSTAVTLTTARGESLEFDHVIMTCHADHTRDILQRGGGMTLEERTVLSGFEFGKNNRVVVHSDPSLMPRRKEAWCAWNYLTQTREAKGNSAVSVTFWMNLLQKIPEAKFGTVLGTLNPPFEPRPDLVIGEYNYEHPHMTAASKVAKAALPSIQNKRGITFAGAWSGYGFHEDGITSSMRAVERSLPDKLGHAVESAFFQSAEFVRRGLVASGVSALLFWLTYAIILCVETILQSFAGPKAAARVASARQAFEGQ
ncbi:FAD/NAD(P)-binding domain-containing protein [Auricularia subglabra TFB-10046 SS5]|nr:FAD/NAD(P)-binding domain-containing protein [Auricularia subglabra TFB-10046 SS5]